MTHRAACFALLLVVLAPQSPQRAPRPAEGVFLVARDAIEGGPFWQSVVLIVSHGSEGTLGVVVNRVLDAELSDVLPDVADEGAHSIHFGGPVTLDGLVFLFRADDAPDGAIHVLEDVYFEGRLETLKRLLSEKRAVKLFLGHAGWAPGQLDAELARGSWDLVRADAFTLFGKEPETLWPELAGRSRTVAQSGHFVSFPDTPRPPVRGMVAPRNSLPVGKMHPEVLFRGRLPMSGILTDGIPPDPGSVRQECGNNRVSSMVSFLHSCRRS